MCKKTLIFVSFLVLLGNLFAQQSDSTHHKKPNKPIQTRYTPGLLWRFTGLTPRIGINGARYDRLVFDLFYNTWLGKTGGVKTKWNSIGFNVNFMFDIPFNHKSTASFAIGLGFSHYNVVYNGMLQVDANYTYTTLSTLSSTMNVRKQNKFVANYLQIPIEFRFRTPGVNHFKFHLGAVVGVRLNSFERWKEGNLKFKQFNFPDINRFRYGVTARIGIRNWSIYAAYFISDLFNNKMSSKLNPLCVGISISLF
jgi:hypothetical protein